MTVKINYNTPDRSGNIAVVYARYSSHGQREQSIEGQIAAAQSYAKARGYTIIREYVDRAQTGRNDDRDEFQHMLKDCASRQFQIIIVWKVDRFGRNREEITFNKYQAKRHGVRVEYVAENLPDSPEAVILESVLEGMAEYYSLQLSQNVRRGFRENAKKCKYAGGLVPMGYKLDDEKYFVIDPDTAPIVREIFSLYAAGQTTTEICDEMNRRGLKTALGRPYTKSSLSAMLKNEKYIGIYDYKNGEIRVEGGVPAIVDAETFRKVQRMLKVNKRAPAHKWTRADYLLTDKLFCGNCGAPMVGESGTGKSGAKYNYYLCVNHKKRGKTCSKKAIRQDWLEPYVLDRVKEILYDSDLLNWITDRVWEYYCDRDTMQEKIRALKVQLSDNEKATNNIMRAIEAGLPLTDVTKARIEELDAQHTALSRSIAVAELDEGQALTRDHILFFLLQFRDLDYSDVECQKRLIDVFVNSIFVNDDEITFIFNFSDENNTVTLSSLNAARGGEVFARCASWRTKKSDTHSGIRFFVAPEGLEPFNANARWAFAQCRLGGTASLPNSLLARLYF